MKLGIIKDHSDTSNYYIDACIEMNINYEIINIMKSNWLEIIKNNECDGFLIAPRISKAVMERLYKEKLYIISKVLKKPIYPNYEEIFLYENKRNMAYWLEAYDIPRPSTWIFYNKEEALDYVENIADFPIVFKPNVGSSSLGIKIFNNKQQAKKLINKIFTKWKFYNRGYTKWYKTRFKISYPIMDDKQYNNLLFQEKIDVQHEWRGVKIGESYFAHKKSPGIDGFHSGSGKANYDNPPLEVMNFLKKVCDIGSFNSMNVDFFEDYNGNFYVNELQTIFGSNIKPYQMLVNNKPGRYKFKQGKWEFEQGMFNQNNSYNLRVMDFLNKLELHK